MKAAPAMAPDTSPAETARQARERLAQTRRELLRQMVHRSPDGDERMAQDPELRRTSASMGPALDDPLEGPPGPAPDDMPGGFEGAWQNIRQTAGSWWRTHPAHLALEVAQPVFERYARLHPVRVVAFSAAAGAALVLLRPWRLISVTGLLVAAVKSTQMSALASAMLRPQSSEPMRRHEQERAAQAMRGEPAPMPPDLH